MTVGTAAAAAIEVAGLTKVFPTARGPTVALQGVTFTVEPGQFCALIGPSGCGKTTLLHILAGLVPPTAGTVRLPRRQGGRLVTAIVFQGTSTLPWLTVRENVAYGLRNMGVPASGCVARTDVQLARVGLAAVADRYPYQLSEGMRQRVSIARALAVEPQVLLMDEPFANLDEQNRLILQDELLQLWQETRMTVLFVTHSLDEALRLADRVLVMSATPGRIKADLPVRLPRPREFRQIRRHPDYGVLSARLWEELREEVLRSRR
ncbi:MAG: ABC transporter ATP-binding protein [Armatimonadota bacterium]|nr:ABC transporter ATP-binding protein [Armatimonadota bacterium]MDR7401172.1 ABC transporter ATP-binding protein [Armatimonadota bacterium]MDR7403408.1 ABC transporter ATP-binding protein [Armatimonadota bacterium]MDR7438013.1 ABC transporter ATP-binding protein [Armatimonadota bacterium]MDR7471827.1 ABC transporter ATP-binding protein [Armatimonadota bacterium]